MLVRRLAVLDLDAQLTIHPADNYYVISLRCYFIVAWLKYLLSINKTYLKFYKNIKDYYSHSYLYMAVY